MLEYSENGERLFRVYIKIDDRNRVIAIGSSAFLIDPLINGWIHIDTGVDYEHHHPDTGYLSGPLFTNDVVPIPMYKYENEQVVERTPDEIEANRAAIPSPPLTETALLKAQVQALTARGEFLEDVIAELAMMVL